MKTNREYEETDYEDEYYDDYEEEEKGGGNKKWILILLLLLLTFAVGTSLFFGWKYYKSNNGSLDKNSGNETTATDSNGREIVDSEGNLQDGGLPFDDPEKLREALQKKVDDSMLAIKVNTNPIFVGKGNKGNLSIENSERNNYDFQVEITLDESGEVIYVTPLMKPGQHILEDKLQKDLEVGEHKATAMFYAYDADKTMMGQAGASINITVKE